MNRILPALAALMLSPGPAMADRVSVLVFDASGSMWNRVEGDLTRIEVARDVMGDYFGSRDGAQPLSVIAYGHNRRGDCADIEVIAPMGQTAPATLEQRLRALMPRGMTPLTDSLALARDQIPPSAEAADIILVTNGLENCEGDPCALAASLAAEGIDIRAHVVGLGLSAVEVEALSCITDQTGGMLFQTNSGAELADALQQVNAVAPEPAPEPEAAPDTPVLLKHHFVFRDTGTGRPRGLMEWRAEAPDGSIIPFGTTEGTLQSIEGLSVELPAGEWLIVAEGTEGRAERLMNITQCCGRHGLPFTGTEKVGLIPPLGQVQAGMAARIPYEITHPGTGNLGGTPYKIIATGPEGSLARDQIVRDDLITSRAPGMRGGATGELAPGTYRIVVAITRDARYDIIAERTFEVAENPVLNIVGPDRAMPAERVQFGFDGGYATGCYVEVVDQNDRRIGQGNALANAIAAQLRRAQMLPEPPPILQRADLRLFQPFRHAQSGAAPLHIGRDVMPTCPMTARDLSEEVEAAFQAWACIEANSVALNRLAPWGSAAGFGLTAIGVNSQIMALSAAGAAAAAPTSAGAAVAASVAATAAAPVVPATGAAGLGITVILLVAAAEMARNDILSKVLLRDLQDLSLTVSESVFYEDASTVADLTGQLTAVGVTAKSRGGDIRGSLISIVTGVGGMKGFEFFLGAIANKALAHDLASNGDDPFFSFPVRNCVVDIEGPLNVEARIVQEDYPRSASWTSPAPFRMVTSSFFRAVDVGRANLLVTTLPGRFGDNSVSAVHPLEVLEVHLTLTPPTQYVTPGDVAGISVTVHNTAHPFQRVNHSVLSGRIDDFGSRDGRQIVVYTQSDPAALPVVMSFEPTVLRGLMNRPTARDRTIFASILPERLALSDAPFCLAAGEDHAFIASYAAGEMTVPVYSADFGGIGQDGVYTAPANARGETATVTAWLGEPEASISFRVGACTCFWMVTVNEQLYQGYYAWFPALFDMAFDRDSDGVLSLGPMVDGQTRPDDEPTVAEISVQALLINYPRDEVGPATSLVFDPPLTRSGSTIGGTGSISSETAPGLRTDLTSTLSTNGLQGTYRLHGDYIDLKVSGLFERRQDGRAAGQSSVYIVARARASYAPYSACEGPDAPLPGRWLGEAFPGQLPQLPQVDR